MYWERILWEITNKNTQSCFFAFTDRQSKESFGTCVKAKKTMQTQEPVKKTRKRNEGKGFYLVKHTGEKIFLGEREAQCASAFIMGKTMREASGILKLSIRTIEFYRRSVRKKLKCQTRAELVATILGSNLVVDYATLLVVNEAKSV